MRKTILKEVKIDEVIETIEAKLHDIALLEEAMQLTRQELLVVQGRITIAWDMIKLRVAELQKLVVNLKEFIAKPVNGRDRPDKV